MSTPEWIDVPTESGVYWMAVKKRSGEWRTRIVYADFVEGLTLVSFFGKRPKDVFDLYTLRELGIAKNRVKFSGPLTPPPAPK